MQIGIAVKQIQSSCRHFRWLTFKKLELNIKCNSRKQSDDPLLMRKCHCAFLHDIKVGGGGIEVPHPIQSEIPHCIYI